MTNPFTSRLYESEQDLREMQVMLMEARAQTGDWRYAHIGDLVFWFWMVACHLEPKAFIRLWHAGDRLIGYAILGEDPSIDWQVLPAYEWRGVEDEAMRWMETRLLELRRRDAKAWGEPCVSGSRLDNPQRMAFLEGHGFRQGGEFSEVNMITSLDRLIPEPALPPGCQVRAFAGADEIPDRAAAYREVWQPWTVGNISDEDYAAFMRLPGYDPELDVVTVAPDGAIAAYVNGWIDPHNRVGDFGPVGARPAYRRQGYTQAALLECLRRMQRRGMQRVTVSATATNTAAIRLYESVGFKIANRYLEYVQS